MSMINLKKYKRLRNKIPFSKKKINSIENIVGAKPSNKFEKIETFNTYVIIIEFIRYK